jgi:hypothetical protein
MGVNMTSVTSRKGLKIQSRCCTPIAGVYFSRAPTLRSTAQVQPKTGRSHFSFVRVWDTHFSLADSRSDHLSLKLLNLHEDGFGTRCA